MMLLHRSRDRMAVSTEFADKPPSATENPTGDDAACCSNFYEKEWVREILDDNFHPGGEALTRRSLASMNLPVDALIADLGCGTGSSALLAAQEYSYRLRGVDLGVANIARAEERRVKAGIKRRQLQFLQHDISALPFHDGELDAILAECSFSLITDQQAALLEFRRVLRPGGLFALSDMAVEGSLPHDIAEAMAPWTCLVNAHDRAGYEAMFKLGGFDVLDCADESAGLQKMISGIKHKLVLIGTGMVMGNVRDFDFDLASAKYWLQRMSTEVEAGRIRYLGFRLVKI